MLKLEKEHTRRGDEVARMRRELPSVRVEKRYGLDPTVGPPPVEKVAVVET